MVPHPLRTLAVALALSLPALAAQPLPNAAPSGYEKVRPERVRLSLPGKTAVTQFLASDRKGRAYLLRGDTLEVFRLGSPAAELDPLGRLACRRPSEGALAAAMDPSGSTWVLSPTGFDLALCDFSEEKRPAGWSGMISSLAYSRTSPLAAVVPFGGGTDATDDGRLKPRVLALERGRWEPVVMAPFPEAPRPAPHGWLTQLKAETDTLLCADAKGLLWLASWNAYKVRKVSPGSSEPREELVVGAGRVEWKDFGSEEREGIAAGATKRGLDPAKNQGGRAYPQNVIRAILCSRDGLVYLVVSTDQGLALDRFDPSLRSLERVLLGGVEVGQGPMTAVLNNDGLLLAGRLVKDGVWRVAVADLESARWKPVPGARVNGKAID